MQAETTDLRQKLLDATAQAAAASQALANASQEIQILKSNEKAKDLNTAELSQRIAALQQELKSLRLTVNSKKVQVTDTGLEKRLREAYAKLAAAETQLTRSKSETAALKEQLAGPHARVETAGALPSAKTQDDKKLFMAALLLKDQELAAIKEEFEDLRHAHELLLNERAEIPAAEDTKQPVEKLQEPEPGLKEKDAQINALRQDLRAAQEDVKVAKEKYAAREIKQDAIDEVIHDRDTKITTLMTEIQALKKELAAEKTLQKDNLAKVDDAASAKILAEKELKANASEVNKLHVTVKDLVSDIKAAKAMVEKKSRDHDATLKELRRLSDILDQKKEELNALQRRVDASVKKAPAAAPKEKVKVTAPDCFKDCVPPVK
jgi:chromosome segregation ATPase